MCYVCSECGNLFKSEMISEIIHRNITNNFYFESSDPYGISRCPIGECTGTIYEIDDFIYPVHKILKDKGYKVTYSCSGHPGHWWSLYICVETHPDILGSDFYRVLENIKSKTQVTYSIGVDLLLEDNYVNIVTFNNFEEWSKGEYKDKDTEDEIRHMTRIGFDIGETEHLLDMDELSLFKINMKCIMTLIDEFDKLDSLK